MDVEGKRGSPPTEKGQKDTMVSEKMAKLDSSFENSAYELGERSVSIPPAPAAPAAIPQLPSALLNSSRIKH